MPFPRPPQAVIFDMDGLLLDTETVYRDAILETSQALGLEMTEALVMAMVGVPWDGVRVQLASAFGSDFPFDDFRNGCQYRFAAACEQGIPVKPGALELIAHLRAAGLPMAVATSTGSRSARDHLSRAGILPHLLAVVGRDDVIQGKPHPEPYLKAAAHLGVEPALCLALEDSHNGVRAAAAAGTMTVMVPDLLPATEEMRRLCVHIASDLGEVRRMLEGTIEAAGRTTRWHRG